MTEQRKIKWGISTLGCHELDLPAICKLAEKHGIHHLEIRSLADCLDLPKYLDDTYPGDHAAVKQILDQHSQSIIALNSGFKLVDEEDHAAREDLLGFARWAELLDVPYVRVFGGGEMSKPLSETEIANSVANLQWWNSQREEHQWKTQIALETHGGFSSGERCVQLQKAFGGPLDIIWDTHHTWKLGGESASQAWEQIGSMVKHVHIKDSISVPSARHPYSYVLPGEGEFPVDDVTALLHEKKYQGIVSLEWERKWHPYLPDLDTALQTLKSAGWRSALNTSPVV